MRAVVPALTLQTRRLPIATIGDALSVQLTAVGGSQQGYRFSAVALPSWLTLTSGGALSGTPGPGTPTRLRFTIAVSDSNQASFHRTYRLIVHRAIALTTSTLPVATVGNRLRVRLHAVGGSGKGYRFTATGLPAWLTLSRTGVLTGMPTTTSNAPVHFSVTVTDSTRGTVSTGYVLPIDPPITLRTAALPVATLGSAYHLQLAAAGGSGSGYTFAARGLPRGLKLSHDGLLSGVPLAVSPKRVTIFATDSARATLRQVYVLTTNRAVMLTSAKLPPATVGSPYRVQLSATGGSGAGFRFFTAIGMPTWLTLSTAGVLSGTPSAVSPPVTVVITVTDNAGGRASGSRSFAIDPRLVLGPGSLPTATAGDAFAVQLTATGGSGAGYRFIAAGLPGSLTLSSSGLLSGTPTANLSSPVVFSVTLADNTGAAASLTYSLPIKTLAQAVVDAGELLFRQSVFERTAGHQQSGADVEASGQVDWVTPTGAIDRTGECFQFAAQALTLAGAQLPVTIGPDSDYVWGTQVAALNVSSTSSVVSSAAFAHIQPGDIVQFRNVTIANRGQSWSFSHHTALIVAVGQTNGVNNGTITVLEQNFNGQQFVTQETFNLAYLTAGKVWIYSPVPGA
jgi:hypothetical protein